jgi:rRNA processing protein Gar1
MNPIENEDAVRRMELMLGAMRDGSYVHLSPRNRTSSEQEFVVETYVIDSDNKMRVERPSQKSKADKTADP